jgi:hypothetical protein
MKRMLSILVLAALPAATGCYHYVPLAPTSAPQGTPVRARLATMSEFELAQFTVNNIDQVEGEMVRLDTDSLVLSATWLQAVTGNGYAGNGWTIRIPEANLAGFEQKRLSWWRTGVVVGGIAVGTWLGFEALGLSPSSGSGGGGTPPPL